MNNKNVFGVCSVLIGAYAAAAAWALFFYPQEAHAAGRGAVIVLCVLGAWFARKNLREWRRLERYAGRLAEGEFSELPQVRYPEAAAVYAALNSASGAVRRQSEADPYANAQVQSLLAALTEGVLVLDAEGNVRLINAQLAEWAGIDAAKAVGRPMIEAVRQHALTELFEQAMDSEAPLSRQVVLFQPEERILSAHVSRFSERRGSRLNYIMVLRDTTELQEYERLRKEFVANVSHELKSPLTGIRGMAETLLDGALEDPANNRRFVQLIDEDARRLARLIDDLLQLSRIEAQNIPVTIESVKVGPLIVSILDTFRPRIEAQGLDVRVEVETTLEMHADSDRLRQILINLIDNAIAYNVSGGMVILSAYAEGETVVLRVEDTGVGIPKEQLSHIFERFYRVDKARSRAMGGTGLGLSIVKHLVELHKGSIEVQSVLDRGTVFKLSFPKRSARS